MDYQLLTASFEAPPGAQRWSAQRRLHECLRAAIRSGQLAPQTRLLATRALALELGIARNTVLYAYEQLATEGLVCTDRRGTVVSTLLAVAVPRATAPTARAGLAKRALALRASPVPAELSGGFAPGVPALAEFPATLWQRLHERSWRAHGRSALGYAEAGGALALRSAIADHLRAARGANCDAGQVFITDGTQSSLDLVARAFADAGDKVWMEHPGYFGAHTAFRGALLNTVGIAVDEHGIAPSASDWRRQRPKLIYVTPSHQYPTGGVLSAERRLALIAHASKVGALIIEDDYDSEFRHEGPPLAAMQGLVEDAPVLYLGTFSKTVFPALRIGFVVVPKALAAPFADVLARSTLRGRGADQLTLAAFMRDGHFGLHLRRMRRLYRQRRDALVASLERHLGDLASIHGDSAGMHLALVFDDARMDDVAISAAALAAGIVAPSLSAHAVGPRAHRWCGLMLGYAQVDVAVIDGLVKQLAAVVRRTDRRRG